ncbi:MAG: hypothetical protein KGJ62_09970 [Armatimonadetes bacterium]|nr:hypothetical protein [Armatimonadota bacterium]MDE2207517.1 hypothetical protein [Armatimonadota bacterium]
MTERQPAGEHDGDLSDSIALNELVLRLQGPEPVTWMELRGPLEPFPTLMRLADLMESITASRGLAMVTGQLPVMPFSPIPDLVRSAVLEAAEPAAAVLLEAPVEAILHLRRLDVHVRRLCQSYAADPSVPLRTAALAVLSELDAQDTLLRARDEDTA